MSSDVTFTVSSKERVNVPVFKLKLKNSREGLSTSGKKLRTTSALLLEMLFTRLSFISTIKSAPNAMYVVSLEIARLGSAFIAF